MSSTTPALLRKAPVSEIATSANTVTQPVLANGDMTESARNAVRQLANGLSLTGPRSGGPLPDVFCAERSVRFRPAAARHSVATGEKAVN